MRLLPFLTISGLLGLIIYGISRTVNASRLVYLIQQAAESSSQLAILVIVSNDQDIDFTQKQLTADILVNGKVVGNIQDQDAVIIAANEITPQGWVLDLPADQVAGGTLQLVRVRGQVTVDNIRMPLDLKYKFI